MIKKSTKATNEISYEVIEDYIVEERETGFSLHLRYMSWNGRDPVYDLRPWRTKEDGTEICGKGITLTGEQLEALGKVIQQLAE